MPLHLVPHPDASLAGVESVEVDAVRSSADTLKLRFRLKGLLGNILVPSPAAADRVDGLWQHTCFEAFVRPEGSEIYYETNLSPSTQWAAYRFESYRTGMTPAMIDADVALRPFDSELELTATIVGLPADAPWQIALSAVIEAKDGSKTYWALRHPDGQPDFHHRDCFALELIAPTAS